LNDVEAARRYVSRFCTPASRLAEAAGVSESCLEQLSRAGALPAPTYRLYEEGVLSPIAARGDTTGAADEDWYGPAVAAWIRPAAILSRHGSPDIAGRLASIFESMLYQALEERAEECARFGWSHAFKGSTLDREQVSLLSAELWADWMSGGWAVCLRSWSGRSVVAKEVQRSRIRAITRDGTREPADLMDAERLDLCQAIGELEAVMLPFAPHERANATAGLWIDAILNRYFARQ
jgi:hypothetical protein